MTEAEIILCGHGSGTPSTKNMESYLSSRYAQVAANGVRKGLVAVRRLKALEDSDRPKFTAKYAEILGRNKYSQNLRAYVFEKYGAYYYSDCSSSICATFQQLGYSVSLLNTAGIYQSSLFEEVTAEIVGGHVRNPGVLKVGDCLLFSGNDPSRPLQIGHVEAVYQVPEAYPESEIEGTVNVTAAGLNIRSTPSSAGTVAGQYAKGTLLHVNAKSGEWFKTDKGWVSRKFVEGWIKEAGKWWYIENGSYPMSVVRTIAGEDYAFDRDGWMLTGDRIAPSGSVIY